MKAKTVKDLKERYKEAVENNESEFTIDGFELVTNYCKFLLEYFELKKIPDKTKLKDILKKAEDGDYVYNNGFAS